MKSILICLLCMLCFPALLFAGSAPLSAESPLLFDDYFVNRTLRIDYFHVGDDVTEIITMDQVYLQDGWAGNPKRLIDPFQRGAYFIKVYDVASNQLLYSCGFSSIFGEYRTTGPAMNKVKRTYHESALIPCPKKPVLFVIEARDKDNLFSPLFKQRIDPADISLLDEERGRVDLVIPWEGNGDPHQRADLAFIGEGYTADEADKFRTDLMRYIECFLSVEPYKSRSKCFNFYGVLRPSMESGADEPRKKIYKNTTLNSSFNALGSPRYLLTEDNNTLRDVASQVPYDALLIMVNSERYGGGGIYRCYAIFTAHSGAWEEFVFLHEFGHSFAGLADEYYSSDVAYNDFFPAGTEPAEPNITALLDPERLKWKKFLSPDMEIPTLYDKSGYDQLGSDYNQCRREMNDAIRSMTLEGAAQEEMDKVQASFDEKLDEINRKVDAFLRENPLKDKVGVFEGAGYMSHGLYRPMLNCLMLKFLEGDKRFCVVCADALDHAVSHYSE